MIARVAFTSAPTLADARALLAEHGTFIAVAPRGVVFPHGWPTVIAREDDDEPAPTSATEDNMKSHEFLWLDLETTGLDPARGALLEFAAVLCEDARGDDFAIVQSFSGVVHHDVAALASFPIDVAVTSMHTKNGLWHDVAASTTTLAEVDAFLAELAASLTGGRKRAVTLAGSSVHFDLAWSRVHLPRFAEFLSHRVFDVSTIRRAVDAWATSPVVWPTRDAHRALDDITATIAEARVARRAMFAAVPL